MKIRGIAGIALGVTGAALAGGVATGHRTVTRARRLPDPFANEPLGRRHTEPVTVVADDGLRLHAEVDGTLDAPLTVIFAHGYTLSMECWHFQRRDLGDVGRLVFYDQRSHGASEHSTPEHSTIDQLGSDLERVIDQLAPTGPVVLVGHSMGGMTIMSLADRRPDLFGERIVGVALLSTSAGQLAQSLVGLPGWLGRSTQQFVPGLVHSANRRSALLERGRRRGSDIEFLLTRYVSYGPDVPPSLVEFMSRMLAGTSLQVMTEFFDTFLTHDKLAALSVLADVPVLISCGTRDTLTPLEHSKAMAAALPDAELLVVPGAGHMALIDRYAVVDAGLRRLVARATAGEPAAR